MSGHQEPVHPDFGFMTDDEVYVRLGPGEEVYIPEWASAGSSIPEGVSTRRTGGASAGSSKPEGVSTEPPDLRQALLAVRSGDDPAVAAGATARTPRARASRRAHARVPRCEWRNCRIIRSGPPHLISFLRRPRPRRSGRGLQKRRQRSAFCRGSAGSAGI